MKREAGTLQPEQLSLKHRGLKLYEFKRLVKMFSAGIMLFERRLQAHCCQKISTNHFKVNSCLACQAGGVIKRVVA